MKVVHALYFANDTVEGRGGSSLEALFTEAQNAEQAGAGSKNFYAPNKPAYSIREVLLFDSPEEYTEFKNGEARKRALAKLTPEDKKVLGIKD